MASLEKMVEMASEKLVPDEVVLASVLGISKRIGREIDLQKPAVLLATDQHVAVFAKDLLGQAFESFSYGDITSALIAKGTLQGSEAAFSVAGNIVAVYRIRKGDVDFFEQTVRERMESAKAAASGQEAQVAEA